MRLTARKRLWTTAAASTGVLLVCTARTTPRPSWLIHGPAAPLSSLALGSRSGIGWRRGLVSVFGLCGALDGALRGFTVAAAEPSGAPDIPVRELSVLHRRFGGDASVHDNQPMQQRAPSGGTISALSVQIPALQKLAPYLRRDGAQIFDLGFGSGVMMALMLALAGDGSKVFGVDLADKVPVARANLRMTSSDCPYVPFPEESFELIGGDAFRELSRWENEGKTFDVMYAGCSMDQSTDQLRRFLGRLKPTGAAVFNLGTPGRQGMYFVADEGKVCELLMRVNFMMAESKLTPQQANMNVPLHPDDLGAWIRANVFAPTREL